MKRSVSVKIRSIARSSSDYPARLEELPNPPDTVWIAGELPRAPSVAIVGTRRADREGIAFAERLARELTRAGATVISGGAEGIDAAAHRGAIERTLVVQAAPLSAPYPVRNRKLFDEVLARGGGWISESPPGAPPAGFRFLARNRIIAVVADAVLVVQAPLRSGALSTARWAEKLGRPVYAVPASPWDPRGEGALALLRTGASLCTSAADLIAALGLAPLARPASSEPALATLNSESSRVLECLSVRPQHVDDIAAACELTASRALVLLVELSIEGRARQENGLWRAVATVR